VKNYIQDGQVIDFVLAFDVIGGTAYYINDIVVVAVQSVKAGKRAPMLCSGVVELPKNPGEAFLQGQATYWDGVNKRLTLNPSGTKRCGFTAEPALAGDANVRIFLYALS
jgi:predicted RecA/RadA family phage recombinase